MWYVLFKIKWVCDWVKVISMKDEENFFEHQSEQSMVKAKIVSNYFTAWSRIMCKNWSSSIPVGYVDLFSGPGVYHDGNESVPIMLIKTVLNDMKLSNRFWFYFNDQDENNIENLKRTIAEIDTNAKLKRKIMYSARTIDEDFANAITINSQGPILSFVDPFGYKGLTIDLINNLIKNKVSDCIFFFNYNRINMALSSNQKFDEYLEGLFGQKRVQILKNELKELSPEEREPIVLNGLIEALKENSANYVLPFKFYRTDMLRTSHFIIFVTKHKLGCSIMKQIMYANSAKDVDGVASFEFKDSKNFRNKFEQLTIFARPLDALCDEVFEICKHGDIQVKSICEKYDTDFSNHYVSRNVKDALIRLEEHNKIIVISGRKQKQRKGKLNMPDGAIVGVLR